MTVVISDSSAMMAKLNDDWNACKTQDKQRNDLIANLFMCNQDLRTKLLDAESELDDKKDAIRAIRQREEEMRKNIEALQFERSRHAIIAVLIDGDCMLFKDDLVQQGAEGGRRAASMLREAVKVELLVSDRAIAHHARVVIRVYANVKGLAKIYKDTDILTEPGTLDHFIRGFNKDDPLCDFIDAGDGKECADQKIKAAFDLYMKDVHCHRILFGGSSDNGYARLLAPLTQDTSSCDRITLLEGPPFARELDAIKDKFRVTPFKDLFRAQKLIKLSPRVSFRNPTPPSTPSVNYATAAATGATTIRLPTPPVQTTTPAISRSQVFEIFRNRQGQRVDSQLKYSQQTFHEVKNRRLCNNFHLLHKCPFLESYGNCQHDHNGTLNQKQLVALRAVARQSPCTFELDCDDPECLCGHRCTRDNCVRGSCKFPDHMHDVDTKIVSHL